MWVHLKVVDVRSADTVEHISAVVLGVSMVVMVVVVPSTAPSATVVASEPTVPVVVVVFLAASVHWNLV